MQTVLFFGAVAGMSVFMVVGIGVALRHLEKPIERLTNQVLWALAYWSVSKTRGKGFADRVLLGKVDK